MSILVHWHSRSRNEGPVKRDRRERMRGSQEGEMGNSAGKTDQRTWRCAKEHSIWSLPFSLPKVCQFPKQAFGGQSSWT